MLIDALSTPLGLASLQRELALTDAEWKRMRARVPEVEPEVVHGPGAATGWASLQSLRARLSLSQNECKAVVLRLPQLLCYSFSTDIAPSLDRIQSQLGLNDSQLKHLVSKVPQMLGLPYEDIAPKLEELRIECNGTMCRRLTYPELAEKVLAKPSSLGIEVRGHHRRLRSS